MKKRILPALLICAVLLSLCGMKNAPLNVTDNDNGFRNQLVEIYQKYDSNIKSNSPFALRRLILSGYSGENTFGASDFAIDKKHSLTILQYESETEAKKAFELIEKAGITVDADARSALDGTDKGNIYPAGSNAIGTPTYIENFSMNKEDVVVAVIDTGMMYDHELMADRFVSRGYDFSDDGRSNAYFDTRMNDAYYAHGTFVCGIIADNTPDNVKILPYKAVPFGSSEASNSAIVAAIYDAVDKGVSVINVSMSTYSGANAFKYAIQTALKNNVCVCASAGNDSKEIKYRYPAATPGVITASALESDMETFASFSNFGSAVDFCAPGRKVVSLAPYVGSGEKYKTNSGTSFSAPYIAAVCADIKSINNNYSKDEVYSIICDFSKDMGQEGYDIYFGNGLPDLSDMVYTDNENYLFKIPEGRLQVINSVDYTKDTQPWRLFADKMINVCIDEDVKSIGAYAFYNMKAAQFDMPDKFVSVGEYAFYSCKSIEAVEFDTEVLNIGECAFGDIGSAFTVKGYSNTAAEVYSQRENIIFISLGCKHNYFAEVVDPTEEEAGYTVYTCSACGDTYTGEYVSPPEYYGGECGMGVSWRYYTKSKALEISGAGYMLSYSEEVEVPWSAFMNKIKSVSIGEDVSYISSRILVNAESAEKIEIFTKTAAICDSTFVFDNGYEDNTVIYAYDDSAAVDYFRQNNTEYISLGCGHSRYYRYYEEQPSCCYDTYGVYTCSDCGLMHKEFLSCEVKGHYYSGAVKTFDKNAIPNAEIYVDGVLSAVTDNRGRFVVCPILCGEHRVEVIKHGTVIAGTDITIERSNLRGGFSCCFGDFDSNGTINAKDYAYALKQDYDSVGILDYGAVKGNDISSVLYSEQELPYVLKLYNEPNDVNENKRDFIAIIENNSEFVIKECGFIYGKNMSEDMLYPENVGKTNENGFAVRMISANDNTIYQKSLTYGSSDGTGVVSARFFIVYTNGVKDFTVYSDVDSYIY